MARVMVEGTVTPSVMLGHGERAVVEYSPVVKNMARRGMLRVIGSIADVPTQAAEPNRGAVTRAEDSRQSAGTLDGTVDAMPDDAPPLNATTQAWRDYLDRIGVEFDNDEGRTVLQGRAREHALREA